MTSIANSKHLVIIIILREFKAVTLLIIIIIYFMKRLNNDSDRSSVLHEHGFSMCVRKAVHIENHHHYRHHHHGFLTLLLLSPSSSLSASASPYCLSELMGPKCTLEGQALMSSLHPFFPRPQDKYHRDEKLPVNIPCR